MGNIGENIDFGSCTGEDIIMNLMVDDGNSTRGHRTNIFKEKFAVTGIACGVHTQYKHCAVFDYASQITPKGGARGGEAFSNLGSSRHPTFGTPNMNLLSADLNNGGLQQGRKEIVIENKPEVRQTQVEEKEKEKKSKKGSCGCFGGLFGSSTAKNNTPLPQQKSEQNGGNAGVQSMGNVQLGGYPVQQQQAYYEPEVQPQAQSGEDRFANMQIKLGEGDDEPVGYVEVSTSVATRTVNGVRTTKEVKTYKMANGSMQVREKEY